MDCGQWNKTLSCPLPLLTFSSQSYVSCLFNVGMITMHSELLSAVLHPDLWFRSKLSDLKRSEDLHGAESVSKLLNGQCLFGAQQVYCSCLLWKRHIMENSWTVFLHPTLQGFYAPNSDILASAETPALRYKDWVTLSAGSGYMLLLFFHPKLPQLLQRKAPPTPHFTQKHTYPRPPPLPHVQMWSSTRVVNCCQHGPTFFSPSAVSHHSRFFQLCFWYLYFHRILITLCFSFHVSPLAACPL